MTLDQAAHACGTRFEARPAGEKRSAKATADEEANLVAEGAADEGDENDDRQRKITAMSGDAGQEEQRLAFEEAAGEQGEIAVLRKEVGERHAAA